MLKTCWNKRSLLVFFRLVFVARNSETVKVWWCVSVSSLLSVSALTCSLSIRISTSNPCSSAAPGRSRQWKWSDVSFHHVSADVYTHIWWIDDSRFQSCDLIALRLFSKEPVDRLKFTYLQALCVEFHFHPFAFNQWSLWEFDVSPFFFRRWGYPQDLSQNLAHE